MHVLGICGSPRNGATEYVLKKALEYLDDDGFSTDFFTVRGKKLNFCIHCDKCLKTGKCTFQDDMEILRDSMKKADGIIMATPVYNGGCSAQLKTIMDRTRAFLAINPDFFRGKIGMGISVGGDRIGGQEYALLQIITFYILNGMIPVSGGFFGANLGATFWSKDTLEGVRKDTEGFRSLRKSVNKFREFLLKYR